jgi:hypothetical protein
VEKKFWTYIIHYLHKHNELCLADFGRFAAQVSEFSVDPVAKKITPQRKRIYFQTGEFGNSPEFLTFIASISNDTPVQIVDNLASFVSKAKSQLKSDAKIIVEDFGTFKMNVMGELEFDSNQTLFFEDQSFGLRPIHFAANLLKTKRIVVEQAEEEEQELVQMRESALKELKVLLDNARVAESSEHTKKSKAFPIIATILTLVLLINLGFFLFKGPVDQIKQQISQMNILGKTGEILDSQASESLVVKPAQPQVAIISKDETSLPLPNSDSLIAHIGQSLSRSNFEFDSLNYSLVQTEKIEDKIIAEAIPETLATEPVALVPQYEPIANPVEVIDPTVDYYNSPNMVNVDAQENGIDKGFYVIAGAFKSEDNANKMKAKMVKKGDTSAIVFKPSSYPYYLVSYQKSKTLNQALNLLEKKDDANPAIWVYCAY